MQTSIEKSSDIFQNDEKGRNFYLFINFLRKYNFSAQSRRKNKKRNKEEK